MKLFTLAVAITYKKIWLLFTFIEQQFSDLYTLVLTHMDNIGCIWPLTDQYLDVVSNNMHVNSGSFFCLHFQCHQVLHGDDFLGWWGCNIFGRYSTSVTLYWSWYGVRYCVWQGEGRRFSSINFQQGDSDTDVTRVAAWSGEVASRKIFLQGAWSA